MRKLAVFFAVLLFHQSAFGTLSDNGIGSQGPQGPTGPTGVIDTSNAPGLISTGSRVISVRVDGSDVVCPATPCGDGSIAKPFLTIDAANAAACTIPLGPRGTEFPVVLDIGPGFFEVQDNIEPCPFTYWHGQNWQGTAVGTVSGGPITWEAPDNADDWVRYTFKHINIIPGLDMSRPTGAVEGSGLRVFNSNFSAGTITLTGAGQGLDNAEFHDTIATNVGLTFNAIFLTTRQSAFGIMAVSAQGVDAVGGCQVNMSATQHRRITVNDNCLVQLFESRFVNQSITFNGTGGTVNADAVSTPVNALTLTGGALATQLVRQGRTSQIGTLGNTGMTTASNWNLSVVPTDLSDAINKIIANLKLLNGNPIGTATGTILAGGLDTPSIVNSIVSASIFAAHDGTDPDETGRDMTLRAGDATQDFGAGLGGTLNLLAGLDSNGNPTGLINMRGSISVDGSLAIPSAQIETVTSGVPGGTISFFSKDVTSGNSGLAQFRSGSSATGDSGVVAIVSGAASGTRGFIDIDGLYIDANSTQIRNVSDPTSAQDAVTLSYLNTRTSGCTVKVTTAVATTVTATCAGSTYPVSGGCSTAGIGVLTNSLFNPAPTDSQTADVATGWKCDYTVSGSVTAYALCCAP